MPYKDPAKAREYSKNYARENKESLKISKEKYYKKNRKLCIQRAKIWAKNNPKKIKQIVARNNKKRSIAKRIWYEQQIFGGNATIVNNYCKICGIKEKLQIHHKDGNNGRMNKKLNNNPENLIVLCNRCHPTIHGWWGLKNI